MDNKVNDNTAILAIPGARSTVKVIGTRGIFFKVEQGGATLKRKKGAWQIAVKGGQMSPMRANGWLPGFQSLWLGQTRVYQFGADVPLSAKILSFLPLGLIALNPYVGALIGVIFVLYNIFAVKFSFFPKPLRIALPVLNTVAGALVLMVLNTVFSKSAA